MTMDDKPTAPHKTFRISQLALVIGFLSFVTTPLLLSTVDILEGPDSPHEEARAKTPQLPTHLRSLRRFVGDSKWYFQRRFGLRTWLTQFHGQIKVEALGVSSSDRVVLGRDSWLYTTQADTLDDYRGLDPLLSGELTELAGELTRRRDRLKERGIPYVLLLCPEKQTIYPEYLPERFRRVSTRTRLDQAVDYLRSNTDLKIVDLRPVLLQAKDFSRVFHRSDTHWNEVGAYIGAQYLVGQLRSDLPELAKQEGGMPPQRVEYLSGGDLARQLALQNRWTEEAIFPDLSTDMLTQQGAPFVSLSSLDIIAPERIEIESSTGALGTVLILRDSFGVALIPWLSPFFEHSIYQASYGLPLELVDQDQPALVIQQLVERKLTKLIERPNSAPVFLGDSLTAGGDWGLLVSEHRNAGDNGATATAVRDRTAELALPGPERVFLMIGTNDLGQGHEIDNVVQSVEQTLDTLAKTSPETEVVLQSVLPVLPRLMPALAGRNAQIRILNQKLEQLARHHGVEYVDLHSAFTDSRGELDSQLTTDGLHLNAAGYTLWRELLRTRFFPKMFPVSRTRTFGCLNLRDISRGLVPRGESRNGDRKEAIHRSGSARDPSEDA
jgi:lysophospholipase L1-like esterase